MGLITRVMPKVGQFVRNLVSKKGAAATDELGAVIGNHLKSCKTVNVGLFDRTSLSAARRSSSSGKPSTIATKILRPLMDRFRSAVEFFKHGHDPERMVSKDELTKFIQELEAKGQVEYAPQIRLSKGISISDAKIISAQDYENLQQAKKMIKIMA